MDTALSPQSVSHVGGTRSVAEVEGNRELRRAEAWIVANPITRNPKTNFPNILIRARAESEVAHPGTIDAPQKL